MSKSSDAELQEVRKLFLGFLPRAVKDWAALVFESDNPEDYQKFIATANKATGVDVRDNAGAGLNTLNVVINMGQITADATPVTIDASPVEKPSILMPPDEAQPAQAEPALALEILPLDE